jgi:hypothetical protein
VILPWGPCSALSDVATSERAYFCGYLTKGLEVVYMDSKGSNKSSFNSDTSAKQKFDERLQ